MKTYDLVIIGSGPAGISAALHLIQLDPGWAERLVAIEKARHTLASAIFAQPPPLNPVDLGEIFASMEGCQE